MGIRPYPYHWTSLIQSIVHEQVRGMSIGEIAARFHRTIAQTTAEMARFFCQELRISTVALSGGGLAEPAPLPLDKNAP